MLNSKHFSVTSAAGVLALLAANGIAHGNERGTAKAVIGSATVTIDYGRPMLKGRDLMKMIQPGEPGASALMLPPQSSRMSTSILAAPAFPRENTYYSHITAGPGSGHW